MRTIRTFYSPQAAYDFLNSWTTVMTSYETQFQGKNVRKVSIVLDGEKPLAASFIWENAGEDKRGFETIDLSSRLRDSPRKKVF